MKRDKVCKKMETLLVSYVHGELDPGGAEKVEEHIKGCDSCLCVVDDLKRSKDLVCSLPEVPAPPDFLISVRKRLAKEPETAHEIFWPAPGRIFAFFFRPPVPQMVLAATFILVFLSAFALGRYMFPNQADRFVASSTPALVETTETAEIAGGPVELVSFDTGKETTAPSPYMGNGLIKPVGLGISDIDFSALQQYQTPSEFVQALIRSDPQFRNSEIHPLPQGALILTSEHLYQVTISDLAFKRAQRLVMIKGGKLPNNLVMSKMIYSLKIKRLPHPLKQD